MKKDRQEFTDKLTILPYELNSTPAYCETGHMIRAFVMRPDSPSW